MTYSAEQLEALADDGDIINMEEALREIAAALRKGRLTDEQLDSIYHDSPGSDCVSGLRAIADAAVLAAMPMVAEQERQLAAAEAKIKDLCGQRDELAESLLESLGHLRWWADEHGCCAGKSDKLIAKAEALLAKVKP